MFPAPNEASPVDSREAFPSNNYYIPIAEKLAAFREKYKDDPEALTVADLHEVEIDMYRKHSNFYGYVFYVMQNI